MSHKFCPQCNQSIIRAGAGPKELCGICDPEHKTRPKRKPRYKKRGITGIGGGKK